MPSTHNSKKRRIDPITTDSQPPGKQHERSKAIYFDDGNIVLVAEGVAFRVHRGQLAYHSDIFRDMFSVVAQPEDAELFDGCPVVLMSDTSADLEGLLQTLYLFNLISSNSPQSLLEGVLRLSTKYILDIPRCQALDALSRLYPGTLSKWDKMGHRDSGKLKPVSIIGLARKTHPKLLLPAAFYDLCTEGGDQDPMDLHQSTLDTEDLRAYYKGKKALSRIWPTFIIDGITDFQRSPCGHEDCDNELKRIIEAQTFSFTYDSCYIHNPTPLVDFKCYSKILEVSPFCQEAKEAAMNRCEAKRAEIWNELPEIFNLGSWTELRNGMKQAYGLNL